MPAPLNRQPLGLLDFLGIKNGGQYPLTLGEQLAPVLEALELYENTAAAVIGSTSGNVAGGPVLFGPAGATSEPGAAWHFRAVSMIVQCPAGVDVAYWRLGAYYGSTFVALTDLSGVNGGFAGVPNRGALHIRDLWLPPGWALAYTCDVVAGAPTFQAEWWGYQYRW